MNFIRSETIKACTSKFTIILQTDICFCVSITKDSFQLTIFFFIFLKTVDGRREEENNTKTLSNAPIIFTSRR